MDCALFDWRKDGKKNCEVQKEIPICNEFFHSILTNIRLYLTSRDGHTHYVKNFDLRKNVNEKYFPSTPLSLPF